MMIGKATRLVALSSLMVLSGGAGILAAHPHMYIDSTVRPVITGQRVERLEVEWKFDAGFTEMIRQDFDKNKNGRLDPAEETEIFRNAFSNLSFYHFFSRIYWNGVEQRIPTVAGFRALLESSGGLSYRFSIPLNKDLGGKAHTLDIFQYDPSYFADINFPLDSANWDTAAVRVAKTRTQAPDHTYYNGQVKPYRLRLQLSPR